MECVLRVFSEKWSVSRVSFKLSSLVQLYFYFIPNFVFDKEPAENDKAPSSPKPLSTAREVMRKRLADHTDQSQFSKSLGSYNRDEERGSLGNSHGNSLHSLTGWGSAGNADAMSTNISHRKGWLMP